MIAISRWIKGDPWLLILQTRSLSLSSGRHGAALSQEHATYCVAQSEYGEKVTFIGVTAEDEATVTEFMEIWLVKVTRPGVNILTYRIALDDERKTNERFMDAAGQGGIPCAFIVGKSGNVEWIGHPVEIDGPLKQIVGRQLGFSARKKICVGIQSPGEGT